MKGLDAFCRRYDACVHKYIRTLYARALDHTLPADVFDFRHKGNGLKVWLWGHYAGGYAPNRRKAIDYGCDVANSNLPPDWRLRRIRDTRVLAHQLGKCHGAEAVADLESRSAKHDTASKSASSRQAD